MLVIGAKGMAKELLSVILENKNKKSHIAFFDNVNLNCPNKLYGNFDIIKNFHDAKLFLELDSEFTLGVGNPSIRKLLFNKFVGLGGEIVSVISNKSSVGEFGTKIGKGSILMPGVVITNDVQIGEGVLININSSVSHDTVIGSFSEIACGVVIPGRCIIGEKVFIGSNATLNPDIFIGDNAIVGAGAVVLKTVPENAVVVGNPARVLKYRTDVR